MKRAGKASRQRRAQEPARRGRTHQAPLQLQLFPASEAPLPAPEPAPPTTPSIPPSAHPEPGQAPSAESRADVDPRTLVQRLNELMPGRLGKITLTDNRSTIVSARDASGVLDVRIQRCFASAPDETLADVAIFLTAGKRSRARSLALAGIREYFAAHGPRPSARRRRRLVLRPVGQTLDLRELRDEINLEYFSGEIDVHITWGRASSRRRRRRKSFSVRLGTYDDQDKVVRIHRCLDRPDVPRYVVESVVYHEMLHAAMPPVVQNGRRRIHTPEFRRRERMFPFFQRAERWLDRNLKRLI